MPSSLPDLCNKTKYWGHWISANQQGNRTPASYAVDGDPGTQYQSQQDQSDTARMYLQIDFHGQVTLDGLTLDCTSSLNDYPRGYEVYVSASPDPTGTAPVVAGTSTPPTGSDPRLPIPFPSPATGRYLRLVQTGSATFWWSVPELSANSCKVFSYTGATLWDGGTSDVSSRGLWSVTTFNALPGAAILDGDLTTEWSSGTDSYSGIWLSVDLGGVGNLHGVQLTHRPSDTPVQLQVEVSADDIDYVAVGAPIPGADTMDIPFEAVARYVRLVNVGTGTRYWTIQEFNLKP